MKINEEVNVTLDIEDIDFILRTLEYELPKYDNIKAENRIKEIINVLKQAKC